MSFTKDAELFFVTGRRGTGKTTLTRALTRDRPKLVIFDPRAEYTRGPQCRSLSEVRDVMRRRWRKGFELSYVPDAGQEIFELHQLTTFLWRAQAPYETYADNRKLTLVVDEMDLSYPVSRLPADMNGMNKAINQGRHVGLEIIGVTQRPAMVGMNFRSQVAATYLFALEEEDDVKAMARKFGRGLEDRIRNLPNYHCLMRKDAKVMGLKIMKNGKIGTFSI